MFDDLSTEELRKQLADFQRAPSGTQHPDAPGCEKLSDAARETARTLYGEALMRANADQIDPTAREFLRASILAALGEL
jgi:hypothetical protein